MSTEAESQVVEQQDENAGFEAGFAEARGEELPTETEQPVAETTEPEAKDEQAEVPQEQTQGDPEPTPEQVRIAGMTEDELKGLLAKVSSIDELSAQVRKAFGKYGELNQAIQALQQRPGGGGMKLTSGQLKRLSGEYPELAELLASDLSEALATGGGEAPQVDFSSELAKAVRPIEQKFEQRLVKRDHPDCEQIFQSKDFRLWMEVALSPEDRVQLSASWDADYISGKLTEYKAWKAEADAQTETQREQKQKRLEQAVAPTGARTGGPKIQSEDDAFAEGFNNVRSARLY